jgi:hypothetical protein
VLHGTPDGRALPFPVGLIVEEIKTHPDGFVDTVTGPLGEDGPLLEHGRNGTERFILHRHHLLFGEFDLWIHRQQRLDY